MLGLKCDFRVDFRVAVSAGASTMLLDLIQLFDTCGSPKRPYTPAILSSLSGADLDQPGERVERQSVGNSRRCNVGPQISRKYSFC